MKYFILTAVALSLISIQNANAQGTEQNYDIKNTQNLESQAGFTVLNFDQPITQDVVQEAVQETMTPQDLNAIESAAGDIENLEPSTDVLMLENGTAETIIRTQKIIGNTDTGVDPDVILRAVEGQN